MPVCVPCALVGLSPSTMALGKFWGPLVSSLPFFTYIPSLPCSMGVFVCACDREDAGQGTL